jgi:hypothetical protein
MQPAQRVFDILFPFIVDPGLLSRQGKANEQSGDGTNERAVTTAHDAYECSGYQSE